MGIVIAILVMVVIGLLVYTAYLKRRPEEPVPETRDTLLKIPQEKVITKDLHRLNVDTFMFYEVVMDKDTDKTKRGMPQFTAEKDLDHETKVALFTIARSCIRDVVGSITFDELIQDRSSVNNKLLQKVNDIILLWGLRISIAAIDEVRIHEDTLIGINEEVYIQHIKKACPDETYLNLMKLRCLEEVSKGEATKIYCPNSIDLLEDEEGGKKKK
jgi:uncharacterized membrane protein YqiK